MNPFTLPDKHIYELVNKFDTNAEIASVHPFGSGHINDTYRIVNNDKSRPDYLLQRINHHVFKDVPALMQNLKYVIGHLKKKLSQISGSDIAKEILTIVETHEGKSYLVDDEGNYWRMFYFLKGTRSYDRVETAKQAFEGGKAFGRFQALLADLDPQLIRDTIPDFHHIESRLNKMEAAINIDLADRVKKVSPEIEFIRSRTNRMKEILLAGKAGVLPLRITHNDTKFNNVLLDSNDHAQCVIDLDTVMPGYIAYDFGDSVRTIINAAAEDEEDTTLIGLNISLFEAYTKGYLQEAADFITGAEIDSLLKGVFLLPYIQAVRFLTDYLEGDHYFKIQSPEHNLQRTRAQLTLVQKLEENSEQLEKIILGTLQHHKH